MDILGRVITRFATAVALGWDAPNSHFAIFVLLAVNLAGLYHLGPVDGCEKLHALAARLACFMFLTLIVARNLTQLAPVRKAMGIGMRAPCFG